MTRLSAIVILFIAAWTCTAQTVKWTLPFDSSINSPTLFPNETKPTGAIISVKDTVVRVQGDGKIAWTIRQPAGVGTPATVADLDGNDKYKIVVALSDGTIVCLDENGQTLWSKPNPGSAGGFNTITAADVLPSKGLELIYGYEDGWLNCRSAQGDLLWRFYGDRFRVGGVAVADVDGDGAPEVVYGTDNGHVYCLDGWGRVKWRFSDSGPYGRSGPVIADVDGDGKAEVLITRSSSGNKTCLLAIDGATGHEKWRTQDLQQSYISIACADFGNGKKEVIHGDKANALYRTSSDGHELWRTELGGRGIFWAPAIADVDGDGQLEIVSGMRGAEPDGSCIFVIGQDGTVKTRLKLGTGANAAPAVGDIDGDGNLEVLVATEGPFQLQCLTWNAKGRVAWPSFRGTSTMSGAYNVKNGVPEKLADVRPAGHVDVAPDNVLWGDNVWILKWNDPATAESFIELMLMYGGGVTETRCYDLKAGATSTQIPWEFAGRGSARAIVSLRSSENRPPAFLAMREASPQAPENCGYSEVWQACEAATRAGDGAHADTALLRDHAIALRAQQDTVKETSIGGTNPNRIAEAATSLRARATYVKRLAHALEQVWRAGDRGAFFCEQDANPWDSFDPKAVPDAFEAKPELTLSAYGNEFEDLALTIYNPTSKALDIRCGFSPPGATGPAKYDLDGHVVLCQAVSVPATFSPSVYDPLPKLNDANTIAIPAGESRQLWIVVDTHGLTAGNHESPLYLTDLHLPNTLRTVPVRVNVWPVELPATVFAKMNWSRFGAGAAPDPAEQDMIDHGMSVIYGPNAPRVALDAQGRRAAEPDWSEFDASLARVPSHFFLIFGRPPAVAWPNNAAPDESSDLAFKGMKTALAAFSQHLAAKGFGYNQWAFYPMDEPFNTGMTGVDHVKETCERIKRADPNVQMYADPTGLMHIDRLETLKGLIDVWQPEINALKRDPELLAWFHANSKHLWAYEATAPAKDLLPLGYYRALGWFAWKFKLEGLGYWVYYGDDLWLASGANYSAIYKTGNTVVPSRRWEADRDGVEDYRALYVLNQEIEKARAGGHAADADKAQSVIDAAVQSTIGGQLGTIDEITRATRDYEIDFVALQQNRDRIAQAIMELRGAKPTPAK